MGQPVAVELKPSTIPGVVRLEANRNLSGMGHERFLSPLDAIGPRPAAVLARRLFDTGRVSRVHVYLNQVTVELERGYDESGLADILRDLYQYWQPGMTPPSFDDLVVAEESAPAALSAGGDVDPAMAEAMKRVPAHLLERSRFAREKWAATHG